MRTLLALLLLSSGCISPTAVPYDENQCVVEADEDHVARPDSTWKPCYVSKIKTTTKK